MGKSWYTPQYASPNGSPRACAFAAPHVGEPFNDFGFFKAHNPLNLAKENLAAAHARSKCSGGGTPGPAYGLPYNSKASELLEYLR